MRTKDTQHTVTNLTECCSRDHIVQRRKMKTTAPIHGVLGVFIGNDPLLSDISKVLFGWRVKTKEWYTTPDPSRKCWVNIKRAGTELDHASSPPANASRPLPTTPLLYVFNSPASNLMDVIYSRSLTKAWWMVLNDLFRWRYKWKIEKASSSLLIRFRLDRAEELWAALSLGSIQTNKQTWTCSPYPTR